MTLQTQLVDVKFDQGIDTRDDGFLRTGNFDEMINVERQKAGGIIKRNGFDMIPQTGLTGTLLKIAEIDNYLMAITTTGVFRYSPTLTTWSTIGVGPSVDVEAVGYPFAKNQTPICVTYSNSKWIAIVFETVSPVTSLYILELDSSFKTVLSKTKINEPNPAYYFKQTGYSIVEMDNGKLAIGLNVYVDSVTSRGYLYIINGISVDSSNYIYDLNNNVLKSVCAYGSHVFASVVYFASGNIYVGIDKILIGSGTQTVANSETVFKNTAASLGVGTETLAASAANASYFAIGDILASNANSVVAITGGFRIKNPLGTGAYTVKQNGTTVYTGADCTTDVDIVVSNDGGLYVNGSAVSSYNQYDVIIWSCNVGNVEMLIDGTDSLTVTNSTSPASTICVISAPNSLASITLTSSAQISALGTYKFCEIIGIYFYFYGTGITGGYGTRKFTFDLVGKTFDPNTQYSYLEMIFKNGNDVLFYDPRLFNLVLSNLTFDIRAVLMQGIANSSASFVSRYMATMGVSKDSSGANLSYSIIRHPLAVTSQSLQIIQETNSIYFSGGYLGEFTTMESNEVGFFQTPYIFTKSIDQAGGQLPAGKYNYAFTFSYINTRGDKEESEPTYENSVVVTGGSKYNLFNVAILQFTNRSIEDCELNVYRTKSNESIYYKALTFKMNTGNLNIPVIDQVLDATLDGKEILYTTGSILPNSAIGACFALCATKNRLFAASSEDKTKIYFSKEKLTGYGFEFSGLQYIDCNGGQFEGEITALFGLDEKIVVGKDKYLLGIYGDGPNAAGGGSDFSIPQQISTDVGVSDKNSAVIVPEGIMFKSKKGIYLINRGMQVTYEGILADKYSQNTVYSSLMSSTKNLVFFGLSNLILVYDYLLKNWFQWKGQTGIIDSISSCLIGDTLHVLTSGGRILKQNSTYLDQLTLTPTSENIIAEIETSWLELGSISGFQRLRRIMFLGRGYGAASLDIKVMRDYDLTVLETHTLAITETAGAKVQVNMHLANQKSASTKLTIKESGTGTANKISLSGMTYELGLKKGTAKVPSTRKI